MASLGMRRIRVDRHKVTETQKGEDFIDLSPAGNCYHRELKIRARVGGHLSWERAFGRWRSPYRRLPVIVRALLDTAINDDFSAAFSSWW